ncbi:Peptidase M20 domain-containing protein 2 [Apiospora phragmitis]|uniref:Peptidase M20 domain-containing protein 2 n=1 Tax=Apiospora phragmitis TaxID=2905665 RepID=A0ABR1VBY7_9PEZI
MPAGAFGRLDELQSRELETCGGGAFWSAAEMHRLVLLRGNNVTVAPWTFSSILQFAAADQPTTKILVRLLQPYASVFEAPASVPAPYTMRVDGDDFVVVTHEDVAPRPSQSTPRYLPEINDAVDRISENLWEVNKKIHDNPELGYKEVIAHETLTTFVKSIDGWKVTPSAYGMKTAWVAVWDNALEGIGHACGHNLIATAAVTGAVATAEIIKTNGLAGKVVLLGTPAEEGGGGKIQLLRAGAYQDHKVDLSLISHPGIARNHALTRTSAYTALRVEYFGRAAHAAASPWLGINALDALVTAYNALSVLRQQTMAGDVVQGNITDGGARPNIIHAYAAGDFVVRANTQKRLEELLVKVQNCFAAGATATGARLEITPGMAYADHVPNRPLGAAYARYFNALLPSSSEQRIPSDQDLDEMLGRSGASTDQGDISHAMPSLSPGFAIVPGPQGNGPHSPDFTRASGTRDAFDRSLRVGKALAGTAVDVLTVGGLLEKVKQAWRRSIKEDV